MASKIGVEGPIVSIRVRLRDTERRDAGGEFPEFRGSGDGRDVASLKASLEDELTSEAQELLETDQVKVEVTFRHGSLEVIAAVIATGRIVAEIGAFLAGVREIRDVFPERIATQVRRWLGRPVAQDSALVEARRGLLSLNAEEAKEATEATEADEAKKAKTRKAEIAELKWYAALSLVVLVTIAGLVIFGVAVMLG